MALPATMRKFEIALSDVDRGVYEALELRVAQHPSETDRYLVTRVIARALEHDEGVAFTRGLAEADEPALERRDLHRGDCRTEAIGCGTERDVVNGIHRTFVGPGSITFDSEHTHATLLVEGWSEGHAMAVYLGPTTLE